MTLRATVHRLLAPAEHGDRASLNVDRAIFAVVVLDLVLFAFAADLPSDVPIHELGLLYQLEIAVVCVFALEYVTRLWACAEDPRYAPPNGSRWRYARTPLALVDLAAALPVLTLLPGAESLIPASFSTLRTVRLVRLGRAIKLVRYSRSLQALGRSIRRIDEELLAVLFVVVLVAVVGANIAHSFEAAAQPETFGTFGDSLWWALVTMTTVGYGDSVPVTLGGRAVAGVLSIAGLAMFAAPAGLLAAAFGDEMSRERRRRERQRDRERREREERILEHLVEEAVAEALHEEQVGAATAERVRGAARRALGTCPSCGQALPGDDGAHGAHGDHGDHGARGARGARGAQAHPREPGSGEGDPR